MKKLVIISLCGLIFISCRKEGSSPGTAQQNYLKSLPLSDTTLIGDTTLFYDVEFNGQRELQIVPLNNCGALTGGTAVPYVYFNYGAYDFDFFANDSLSTLTIKRGYIQLALSDTTYLLKNQRMFEGFKPGAYSFTTNPIKNSGIIIERHDSTGKLWSSASGTADQTASTFQIEKQVNRDPSFNSTGVTHYIYLRCRFKCTLYDGSGNSIQVTNGRAGITIWL